MKVQTRKKSNAAEVIGKAILINPRGRDVVFEAVEEALMPQATVGRARKIHTK